MRRLIWQSVVTLGLLALIAQGPGSGTRADDAGPAEHADGAHAADHEHAGQAGHDEGDAADGEHSGHAAGGEEHIDTSKPPIFPNRGMADLFVFSLLFFLLYLYLAKRYAWLPLIEGLDSREARVNRALAEAESARVEAQKLLADHQAHLDAATEKVKGIIAQARTEAEQEKARVIAEAEAETTAMRDQAIAEIHAARQEALTGMDDRIDDQVSMATRHVLG